MSDVIVPILCALLPLLLGGLGAYVRRWRCRATALEELEILSRFEAGSVEARYVRELLSRRIRTWWQKETAGTETHAIVTLTCVSILYLIAVAGWAGHHLLRSNELDQAAAERAGDLAAAGRAELAIAELVAAGDLLKILAYIAVGLGLCHALFWLARHILAKRKWVEVPDRVPGPDLLRSDDPARGIEAYGRRDPGSGTATQTLSQPSLQVLAE